MTHSDARKLAELLRDAFPRPETMTEARLEIHAAALEELDAADVAAAALQRLIRTEPWRAAISTIRETYSAIAGPEATHADEPTHRIIDHCLACDTPFETDDPAQAYCEKHIERPEVRATRDKAADEERSDEEGRRVA